MKHIIRNSTAEELERHRRLREEAEQDMPLLVRNDRLYCQLRSLTERASAALESMEQGNLPSTEQQEQLRVEIEKANDLIQETARI